MLSITFITTEKLLILPKSKTLDSGIMPHAIKLLRNVTKEVFT